MLFTRGASARIPPACHGVFLFSHPFRAISVGRRQGSASIAGYRRPGGAFLQSSGARQRQASTDAGDVASRQCGFRSARGPGQVCALACNEYGVPDQNFLEDYAWLRLDSGWVDLSWKSWQARRTNHGYWCVDHGTNLPTILRHGILCIIFTGLPRLSRLRRGHGPQRMPALVQVSMASDLG